MLRTDWRFGRRPNSGATRTANVSSEINTQSEFLRLVLDQAVTRAKMDVGTLHVLDADRKNLLLRASHGLSEDDVLAPEGVHESPLHAVMREGRPAHFHEDHHLETWRDWLRGIGWRSAALIPLKTHEQTVGMMTLGSRRRRDLSPADRHHLLELAGRTAMAIVYDSVVRASASDLPELIHHLGRFSPSHVLESLLDLLLSASLRVSQAHVVAFVLMDHEKQRPCAILVKALRTDSAQALKEQLRKRFEAIAGPDRDSEAFDEEHLFEGLSLRHSIPLQSNSHRFGRLALFKEEPWSCGAKSQQRLATIASEAARLIDKTSHVRHVDKLIFTDPLTGLYTRRYWRQRAEQELDHSGRRNQPLSVVLFDLDYFKKINDSFGHPCGDKVLCAVADALKKTVRKHDVVARYGGEEFIVLLAHANSRDGLMVANRLLRAIEELKVSLEEGVEIHVTASGGVTTTEDGAADLDDLIRRADAALFLAKRSGRDRVCGDPDAEPSPGQKVDVPSVQDPVRVLIRAAIARMCHEVNNPATVILGTAELLLETRGAHLDDATRRDIERVVEQAYQIGQATRRMANLQDYVVTEHAGIPMLDLTSPEEDTPGE